MACEICGLIKTGKLKKLYEDKNIIAVLNPGPSVNGHIWLMPKNHYTIIEQVPDYIIAHLFNMANKISVSLFEALGAEGTNLIVQNGIAAGQKHSHFMIDLIPRSGNDGLSFEWQPKQLTEEEMSTIELRVKEETKNIGAFEEEKPEPVNMDKEKEILSDEENYLVKQLRRIP